MMDIHIEDIELAAFLHDVEIFGRTDNLTSIAAEFLELVPRSVSAREVESLLKGESDWSWVIESADRICSGNDGRKAMSGTHLESIVASVEVAGRKGVKAELPVCEKNASSCLGADGEGDVTPASLFDALVTDMRKLPGDGDFDSFFASLDSLFEHYLSNLPSVSAGVSLYQRSKTMTAVASSVFVYACENNMKTGLPGEEKAFVLLSGDATGIQKYIFGINSYKHSTKLIRAKSFQIWIQSFLIAGAICSRLGLTKANIITFSGGKFLLLLPALKDLDDIIAEIREEVDRFCIDSYCGEISYVISHGVKCSEQDLDNENAASIQRLMRADCADAKQKKLQAGIFARNSGPVLEEQYEELARYGSVCVACETNPSEEDSEFCTDCEYMIELGRRLNRKEGYIHLNFSKIASLSETVRISTKPMEVKGFQEYAISRYEPGKARLSMPYYVPVTESGDVLTFEDIAKRSKGVGKLAMFKADVDFLGFIFSSSLKERWSLSRYASLSSQFHFFFSETLVTSIQKDFPDLYVVFSGGDDVCVIGPWNVILDFSVYLNELFGKFTAGNESITISAGIVMFNHHDPIPGVAEKAEEALEKSKDQKGKNSVTLFSRTISWPMLRASLKDADTLQELNRMKKSGFLYRILTYSDNAYDMEHEELTSKNISKALWMSHYRYALKRYSISKGECSALLDEYREGERMKNAKIAASIALFMNRGGNK